MAKKRRPRLKLSKEQKARKKRLEKLAVRRIAKEEGITQKEARKLYKDAVVEFILIRPQRGLARRFVQISPGKFREVPKGKQMKEENAIGPILKTSDVSRIIRLKRYWNTIRILADERKEPIALTRLRFSKGEIGYWDLYKLGLLPTQKERMEEILKEDTVIAGGAKKRRKKKGKK